jgi:pyruvate dehydrogenase E2 component (dihydrolipoamide acetyltransferase)
VPRTPLRMPKMSMTMESGELGTWHVSVGDRIETGQVVCDVMTDKVDMDVESTASGTVLELVAQPGDTVPVGEPLAWVDATSDSLLDDLLDPDPPPSFGGGVTSLPIERGDVTAPPNTGGGRGGIVPAIPGARRLAAEHGVDLRSLPGSGDGGAVLVSDVRTHLAQVAPAAPPAPPFRGDVASPRSIGSDVTSPGKDGGGGVAAPDDGALWAVRAAALAPRPGAPTTSLWRDAVLPGAAPPDDDAFRTALAVALSRALAAQGPPDVRDQPRAGLAVLTPAGPVTITFSDLHRLAPDAAAAAVGAAVGQARAGVVDVGLLAPPDAVATWVPDADRVAPPAPDGPLVALGVGAAGLRVVPVGDGVGVRVVVTLGATAARHADVAWTARLLAHVARELPAALAVVPGQAQVHNAK